jgi:phosphoesterase RecJ-like protein
MRRFSPIIKIFQNQDDFLITSHVRPDGDSIGSSLALALFLEKLKKKVCIIHEHPILPTYEFLPGKDKINLAENYPYKKFPVSIVLDCNDLSRIGKVKRFVEKSPIVINIDHHSGGVGLGKYNYINEDASSVCEIIYKIIKMFGNYIDYDIALCLYVGIVTDTGYFRQNNTTSECLNIIADLIKLGIKPKEVYSLIYETTPYNMMKLIGQVLAEINLAYDNKLLYTRITKKMYEETGISDSEIESEKIFTHLWTVKGVQVIVLFRELEPNITRVNLRAKELDVLQVAKRYNGGGHKLSAGIVINKNLQEAEKLILEEFKNML